MSTFVFTSTPTQCQPLTLEVLGSGGQPPYTILIVPAQIVENSGKYMFVYSQFDNSSFTIPELEWPQGSQFVAMVSDSRGVGSVGTTQPISVAASPSNNTACLANDPVFFDFIFGDPAGPAQCENTHIVYNTTASTIPPLSSWVIYPGGQSFAIPLPPGNITSFDWLTDLREGTQVIFAIGDARGPVSASSTSLFTIIESSDSSCLNAATPSQTSGPVAGQVFTDSASLSSFSSSLASLPTSTSGTLSVPTIGASASSSASSSSSSNLGAIVGGAVGGVVVIAAIVVAIVVWCMHKKRSRPTYNTPTSTFQVDPAYQPTPYTVPSQSPMSQPSQGVGPVRMGEYNPYPGVHNYNSGPATPLDAMSSSGYAASISGYNPSIAATNSTHAPLVPQGGIIEYTSPAAVAAANASGKGRMVLSPHRTSNETYQPVMNPNPSPTIISSGNTDFNSTIEDTHADGGAMSPPPPAYS